MFSSDPRLAKLKGTFSSPPPPAEDGPQAPLSGDMGLPYGLPAPLPAAPPSAQPTIERKRYRPFDKEHISSTLAAISAGFLSHPESFAAGLGGAAQNVSGARSDFDALQRKSSVIGGPDNAFDITTDPVDGTRTVTPIPEVQDYVMKKTAAAHDKGPSYSDMAKMRQNGAAAVLRLPPDKQEAAFEALKRDSASLGYDLGLPAVWDPQEATVIAGTGITPTDRMKDDRVAASREQSQKNSDRSYGLSAGRLHLATQKYLAPPSTRKAKAKSATAGLEDLAYLK